MRRPAAPVAVAALAFREVAGERGLDCRHGAFRFGVSAAPAAMSGGGAAAEVPTRFTGSPYVPGGMLEWNVERGTLVTEPGPAEDLTLQLATSSDAADDAGSSRLDGGIHIGADDFAGRRPGAICGTDARERAQRYFDGSARA